jgi:hypothetical protein
MKIFSTPYPSSRRAPVTERQSSGPTSSRACLMRPLATG